MRKRTELATPKIGPLAKELHLEKNKPNNRPKLGLKKCPTRQGIVGLPRLGVGVLVAIPAPRAMVRGQADKKPFPNLRPRPSGELDRLYPPNAKWQRKSRMSQLLSSEIGHPHVEKLVAVTTMLFKLSDNKDDFKRHYARAFPKLGDQYELLPPPKD